MRRPEDRILAAEKRFENVRMRTTPARASAAWKTASEDSVRPLRVSALQCGAPSCVDFIRMTGFVRAAAASADRNAREPRTRSR